MFLVDGLRQQGIEVEIEPSRQRNNPETIAEYSNPWNLPPDEWRNVTFKSVTREQMDLIYAAAADLRNLKISFDTGGGCGNYDWELDWSFSYDRPPAGCLGVEAEPAGGQGCGCVVPEEVMFDGDQKAAA